MARRSDQPWADSFRLYVMARRRHRRHAGGVPDRLRRRGRDRGTVLLELPEVPLPGLGRWASPCSGRSRRRRCWPGSTTACGWPPSSSASAPPTRWPTPSGCSARCPPALLRDRHRPGRRRDRAAPVRRQRPPGARRPEPARGRHRAGSAGSGASWCRCSRTPSSARCALAAGMDTRGYGRSGGATRRERRLTGALMLAGLCGICVGRLRRTRPHRAAAAGRCRCSSLGVAVAVAGLVSAGRRVAAHPLPAGPVAAGRSSS